MYQPIKPLNERKTDLQFSYSPKSLLDFTFVCRCLNLANMGLIPDILAIFEFLVPTITLSRASFLQRSARFFNEGYREPSPGSIVIDWRQGLYMFITLNSYIMSNSIERQPDQQSIDLMGFFSEHTCDAEDDRDCSIMKHLILAEIRRSNAPAWVAQELEKKLECRGCWNALAKRAAVYLCPMNQDRLPANSRGYFPGNRKIL